MNSILQKMIFAAQEEARAIAAGAAPSPSCNCKEADLHQVMIMETHLIGEDGDFFQTEVPLVRCLECGLSYTDYRAEELRNVAACRHLGRLIPSEVKALRHKLGMSHQEAEEVLSLPPKTMERWERGCFIQSAQTDSRLRLLAAIKASERRSCDTSRRAAFLVVSSPRR